MSLRRWKRPRKGSAMVESALALGATLYMLCVVFDYGMLIFVNNQMPFLANEGARWAAVRGTASGASQTNAAGITAFVKSRAVGLVTANLTVTPTYSGGGAPGTDITVTVSYPVKPITMYPLTSTMTVSSKSRMEISQ